MATTKKFSIENPTSEMIDNLEASAPGEDGFHVTKLSARDSAKFIEMLENPPEPSEEVRATPGARQGELPTTYQESAPMSDTSFFMEPLDSRHDRKLFGCGEPALDEYLQRYARQSTKIGASRTHVAVLPGETRVCAYLTLSAGAVASGRYARSRTAWLAASGAVHSYRAFGR